MGTLGGQSACNGGTNAKRIVSPVTSATLSFNPGSIMTLFCPLVWVSAFELRSNFLAYRLFEINKTEF
jgi:hypothetical protein